MTMLVECKSNTGFEDQLTTEEAYQVQQVGENSYLVTNDKGDLRYYGQQNFNVVLV